MAWRDNRPIGRIAAIDDHLHNEVHKDNVAMFGFFEAEDLAVARALLERVETWARQRGRTSVRGPLNPSLNESAGLLIEGFDTDPMLLMPHNPPAYADFIESAGYRKAKDLFAWLYALDREFPTVAAKLARRMRDRLDLALRPLNLKEFASEVARLRILYREAWDRNWGFVPPTEEEFGRIAREMKPIFDSRCAVCAEVDGRMVACAIAIPDINQALRSTNGRLNARTLWRLLRRSRHIDQARLLLLGVAANVTATRVVAEATRAAGARLVHISSLAAAGPASRAAPRAEDDPPAPMTAYGRSKLAGERAIEGLRGLQWTILRPGVVYGPRDRAVLALFRMARAGMLPLVGRETAAYTMIHVADVVRAIEAAVDRGDASGEMMFVGHPEPVSARALVEGVRDAAGGAATIVRVPRPLLWIAA